MEILDGQVHYTHKRPTGDQSGMRLKLTDAALPFSAGMMMYASYFQIPPRKPSHLVPTKCCYAGFEPAYGFAYRVHTHALGRSDQQQLSLYFQLDFNLAVHCSLVNLIWGQGMVTGVGLAIQSQTSPV